MRESEREWEGRWCVKKKKQTRVIKEKSIVNPVYCSDIIKGKLYFYYHDKENNYYMACYELQSGRTYDVTPKDVVYNERYYDGMYELDEADMTGDEFGYEDTEDIMDMAIMPEPDAYFEEVFSYEKKK